MAETLLINGISFQPDFLLHPQRRVTSLSQTQLPLTWVMSLFPPSSKYGYLESP